MKTSKQIQRDLKQIRTPTLASVLPSTAHTDRHTAPHRRKKWLTAPMAVAMACLLVFGAAAAGVTAIRYLNRDVITENNTVLTEVPEGYVGIYTVADLVKIRDDVTANAAATHYILMSDITFTDADYAEGGICEGGWEPIPVLSPDHTLSPIVMFNGNGHVIRNLQCRAVIHTEDENDRGANLGLFAVAEYRGMTIINLGMEDCTFTIENTQPATVNTQYTYNIGAIAGSANYIGSCYVDGMTVEIRANYNKEAPPDHADNEFLYVNVGGIAGNTDYADACYAENVTIRVIAEGEGGAVKLHAGGIAGIATSALTCWTDGTLSITAEGDNYTVCETDPIANLPVEYMVPTIMTEEAYHRMMAVIAEKNGGEDAYNYQLVRAFYLRHEVKDSADSEQKDDDTLQQVRDFIQSIQEKNSTETKYTDSDLLAQANRMYQFVSRTNEWQDVLYVFDPGTDDAEYERLGTIFLDTFGSADAFREFCLQHNIRLGEISCYTFPESEQVAPDTLIGFDFETLWTVGDGRPRLKIFTE